MVVSEQVQEGITPAEVHSLREVAQQIRVDGIRISTAAGSGHPTSSMSAADLITVLAGRHLRYDFAQPHLATNDHLIFSKGHASPLLYGMYKAVGAVDEAELMTYRTHGSRLQGHPTPVLPWVDVATGSLGQGLPIAVGVALAGKYLDKLPFHVWVLCGDSEMAEGSMWEALDKAGRHRLGNLTAIIDVNRLGQRGETEFGWDLEAYRRRVEAFGCRALVIDGHDIEAIDGAFATACGEVELPTVIVARTVKGKGFSEVENQDGWHGKPLPADMAERAITELGGRRDLRLPVTPPKSGNPAITHGPAPAINLPSYTRGEKVATRKAYGDALKAIGAWEEVVAVDGEVSNSTYSVEFQEAYPERFFEAYIAEQQLVATAIGLGVRGYRAFASTFAAFFARAYDFTRMAGVSGVDLKLSGSHAGCEIGADGPSQMALEDIASIRAIRGSTVLYPSDAVSTAKLVRTVAELPGVSYLRTTRGAYPVLYGGDEEFRVGGSKTLRQSDSDRVTLAGAGVTLHHCLTAANQLAAEGIAARVIDLYSVKPIDRAGLRTAVAATGGNLIVVEDHYPEGGIGSAVLEALSEVPAEAHADAETGIATPTRLRFRSLAVTGLPCSGTPEELMDSAGISPRAIVEAVRGLLTGTEEG